MSIDSGIQAQIKNIEAEYGKPIAAWLKLVRASGLQKHTEVVAMLKQSTASSTGQRIALDCSRKRRAQTTDSNSKRAASPAR